MSLGLCGLGRREAGFRSQVGAVMQKCAQRRGVGVSLAAGLHGSLEAGFKKNKTRKDSPLLKSARPTETFPGSSVVTERRPVSGGGRLARREVGSYVAGQLLVANVIPSTS